MDDLDRAKDLEMKQREVALESALSAPEHDVGEEQLFDEKEKVICLDCCERIPSKRLKAVPEAVRCIDCKTIWERKRT